MKELDSIDSMFIDSEKNNSELDETYSTHFSQMKRKSKYNALIIMIIIITLFLVIIILSSSETFPETKKIEIIASFNISNNITQSKILGDNFKTKEEIKIYYNNKKINYTKAYKFPFIGINELKMKIYNNNITMDYMFENISDLINIEIKATGKAKIINMRSAFANCTKLNEIKISGFNLYENISLNKLFYNDSELRNISLDKNFLKNNIIDISEMFYNCNSLYSLNLSMLNTSNVVNMSSTFKNCSNLNYLDLSNFNTSSVIDMSNMFENCQSIKNLNLSNFNTTNVQNMKEMFSGCGNLTYLDISTFDIINCNCTENMFDNCSNLSLIMDNKTYEYLAGTLPDYVKIINDSIS